jgi:uncharacterized lipoprotein YbaY/uncharacterized membrane protein/heat shock protein HslJ/membrane-bound inhibitor of C-type lysozyme
MSLMRNVACLSTLSFVVLLCGCEAANDGAPDSRVSGAVVYRERMALPPNATVTVRLQDVSQADAPAELLAEQTIAPSGRQVPIPFELRYSSGRIDPRHHYAVRAEIRDADGTLLFATTEHHAVITAGAPTEGVDVLVQRVGAGSPQAPNGGPQADGTSEDALEGAWRLVAFQEPGKADEAIAADPPYTIEFRADNQIAGQADCNRYFGGYTRTAAGALDFSPVGATLALCAPPSRSSEFLRALDAVGANELAAGRLRLAYGDGGLLTFERDAPEVAAAAPEVGRTSVFDCGGDVSFTVRGGPGEVALWAPASLGGQYVVLSQSPAASGARYSEGDTVFWNSGDVATFEIEGQVFVDCKSNPAKVPWADAARRGVTFRALGNEPSWSFEVQGRDLLVVVSDLGATRTELPYAEPTVAGSKTTYRAATGAHELLAVIDRAPCVDGMSGEAFEAAATVTLDGRTLMGCGRFL